MKHIIFFIAYFLSSCCKSKEPVLQTDIWYPGRVCLQNNDNCGDFIGLDTNFDGGTDILAHPLNLPDSFKLNTPGPCVEYEIRYKRLPDTFYCERLRAGVGSPYYKYPKVEVLGIR